MEKISETILKFLRLDNLIENVTGYAEARIELLKVEIREDVAKVLSRGVMFVAMFFMAFLFLIFFSVGLAQFISIYFETQSFAGYWIVAALYASTFLILFLFRKNIQTYFDNQFGDIIKRKEK